MTPFHRRWFAFSLRTLLVGILLVGLSVGYLDLSRRFLAQRHELAQLRAEAGYLAVDDPLKVYILEIPRQDAGSWKWKIHLPPNEQWRLKCAIDKIVPEGFAGVNLETGWEDQDLIGDFALEVFVSRKIDGAPRLALKIGDTTKYADLTNKQAEDRFGTGLIEYTSAGGSRMAVIEPTDQIQILRLRVHGAANPGTGMLLWLERRP